MLRAIPSWAEVHPGAGRGIGNPILLGIVVVLLFAVDPPVATLRPHAIAFREAAAWSAFFVAVAAEFGLILASLYASATARGSAAIEGKYIPGA